MRNRLFAAALAAMLVLNLIGCDRGEEPSQPSPSISPSPEPSVPASAVPSASPSPEPSADGKLLLSFLNGETDVVVGEDFYNDLAYICADAWDGVERLTFSDLTDMVVNSFEMDEPQTAISYALMKTRGGREMLALRYQYPVGVEEFWAYFILGAYGQELRLTYAEDRWSRSDTRLHQGLIFDGDGSGGAGDHHTWLGYINEEGHYCPVYRMESLYGQWVAMHAYEIFDDTDWSTGCECYLLTTNEGEFYELSEGEDTDPEKLALLRKYLEGQSKTEVSDMGELIDAAMDAHGLTEDAEPFEDWVPIDGPMKEK